jgi:hypothetical protein
MRVGHRSGCTSAMESVNSYSPASGVSAQGEGGEIIITSEVLPVPSVRVDELFTYQGWTRTNNV